MTMTTTAPSPTPPVAASVWVPPDEAAIKRRVSLFDKLVSLGSRSPDCLRRIALLTRDEQRFSSLVTSFEKHLQRLPADAKQDLIAEEVPEKELHALCLHVTRSNALLALLKSGPSLASRLAREVGILAAMADLRPDPESMLKATDGPFMRILRQRTESGTVSADGLLLEDFLKLATIAGESGEVLSLLAPLAETDDWVVHSVLLERSLLAGRPDELMPSGWRAVFDEICRPDRDPQQIKSLTELLRLSPSLSEMLPEEVRAFSNVYQSLKPVESMLSPSMYGIKVAVSELEMQKFRAKQAVAAVPADALHDITSRLEVRQWAAGHCLDLRAFVKLNALERQWPELARMLRRDRSMLKALEGEAMRPGTIAPEHKGVWERYAKDEQLQKFLVIRPLVTEINPRDVRHYFTVSQTMMPAPERASTMPPGSVATAPLSPLSPRVDFDYEDVLIRIEEESSPTSDTFSRLKVTMMGPGGMPPAVEFAEGLQGSLATIHGALSAVSFFERDVVTVPGVPTREPGANDMQASGLRSGRRSDDAALRRAGAEMARLAFPGSIGEHVLALLRSEAPCRLLLQMPPSLGRLPWEMLYLDAERVFLGLTQQFSVVRYTPGVRERRLSPIAAPLRILAVLSNPIDLAPLNLEAEQAVLSQALGAAIEDGRVKLEFLKNATIEQLQGKLRVVRPHVLHFMGHGVFDQDRHEGGVVLGSADGHAELLTAAWFATMLRDHDISIAVLNSCDTGTSAQNDAVTGVAGSLVQAGVPAVIATLRLIRDDAGRAFSSELYRAFSDGYTLEAALAEGRKRLSFGGWDWSAYALFANTSQLGALVFPQEATLRA